MRAVLILLLAASGCSSVTDAPDQNAQLTDPPGSVEEYADDRASLVASLDAAIGEARATNMAACRVIPFGSKACGGPTEYRVYSATDGDTEAVHSLSAEITALDTFANREFGLISDCMLETPPMPTLVGGRCTASGR